MNTGLFPWKQTHTLIMSHMCLNTPTHTHAQSSRISTGGTFTKPAIMMVNGCGWSRGLSLKINKLPRGSFADNRMWNARWKILLHNHLTNIWVGRKKVQCFYFICAHSAGWHLIYFTMTEWVFFITLSEYRTHLQDIHRTLPIWSLWCAAVEYNIVIIPFIMDNSWIMRS